MKIKNIVNLIEKLETYPIEYVFAKQFILAGVKSESELQEILKINSISNGKRWSIQNAYRDIVITKIVDINEIAIIS
jgi:hypothetical protein